MKKKFLAFLLVFLILITGCTNLNIYKKEVKYSKSYIRCKEFLANWDIENAKENLKLIEDEKEKKEIENQILKFENYKLELKEIIFGLSNSLKENDIETIKKSLLDNNIINSFKIDELKKIDFSNTDIIFGEPIFEKEKSKVLVAINYYDDVFYYEIVFRLDKKNWKIVDFYEKE